MEEARELKDDTYQTFEMEGMKPPGVFPDWLKVVLGCGLGCLIVVALSIGGCGYLMHWLISPGVQFPSRSMLSEESVAAIHLGEVHADAAANEMIGRVISQRQRAAGESSAQDLPEFMRWTRQFEAGDVSEQGSALTMFLPGEVTVIAERAGPEGGLQLLGAVNFPAGVRVARLTASGLAGEEDVPFRKREWNGHEILEMVDPDAPAGADEEPFFLRFQEGTVLVSKGIEIMHDLITRTEDFDEESAGEDCGLRRELDGLSETWLLSAVMLDGRRADLFGIIETLLEWEDWRVLRRFDWVPERFERCTIGLRVGDADTVLGRLVMDCADAGTAVVAKESLIKELWDLAAFISADESGMQLRYELGGEGARIDLGLRWTGIEAYLAKLASPVMLALLHLPAALCLLGAAEEVIPGLEWIGRYDAGFGSGAEIASVQARTRRAVLSMSSMGRVDLLDLSHPARPERLARHDLGLAEGEELTSVAFHPTEPWYLAAIRGALPGGMGRVEIRAVPRGELLRRLDVGVEPDCVAVDPTGRWAAVANEAESVRFEHGIFSSEPGSVSLVALTPDPSTARAWKVSLPDLGHLPEITTAAALRSIERSADWNRNGRIDTTAVDFDGDGELDEAPIDVGRYGGGAVLADEATGEVFSLPLRDARPEVLEPEVVAFSADGALLFVTLQENNAVCVVDVEQAQVLRSFGLGTTTHAADLRSDGEIRFEEGARFLREPDGLALSPDGRLLVTADEGDTDPKASKLREGLPLGGGRTVSVFDARTGSLLGDTGGQLDTLAAARGVYPEHRSDSKGSEPEMVVVFEAGGLLLAAVGLERAGAVALVSLADPASPRVLDLSIAPPGGSDVPSSPEGIAHYAEAATGAHFVLAADELRGTLEVFRVVPRRYWEF